MLRRSTSYKAPEYYPEPALSIVLTGGIWEEAITAKTLPKLILLYPLWNQSQIIKGEQRKCSLRVPAMTGMSVISETLRRPISYVSIKKQTPQTSGSKATKSYPLALMEIHDIVRGTGVEIYARLRIKSV